MGSDFRVRAIGLPREGDQIGGVTGAESPVRVWGPILEQGGESWAESASCRVDCRGGAD